MMNIFTTLPKFGQLVYELRRYNKNEAALMAARKAGDFEEERRIIIEGTGSFAYAIAEKYKLEVEIRGEENLPESGPVYFVANHQSYADILMLYYAIRKFQTGFIAKAEFSNVPIFSKSIELTRSIFIDRGNTREAIKTMNTASELLENGFSLVIFPEGTRSRSHKMGEFKPGSFKPAQKAKVPVVPVTLEGGYHLLEETGSYQPCKTIVQFHPAVPYGTMDRKEQHAAASAIEQAIRDGLSEIGRELGIEEAQ